MPVPREFKISFDDLFPHGAFVTGPVEPVSEFDEKVPAASRRQKADKDSGLLLWDVPVHDADPEARASSRSVKIRIAAKVQPTPPDALPGLPFRPVEFDNLTVAPYVNRSTGRMAHSIRATGMHAPAGRAAKAAA
ncbi:plasmid replication, integration and excision activator [Candidatus Protofrankia californiensis]|uniref:plasmid replication, integration and excision activator n=1 Tax=Candidatus Protofrankia californiensis TaxID=1839754 RepID=UPI00104120C7|nr:plasmid replication, integration and excision activator [Candidatus Protofrankia californiensis]